MSNDRWRPAGPAAVTAPHIGPICTPRVSVTAAPRGRAYRRDCAHRLPTRRRRSVTTHPHRADPRGRNGRLNEHSLGPDGPKCVANLGGLDGLPLGGYERTPSQVLFSPASPAPCVRWLEGTLRTGGRQLPEGARSASPGLLESNPWRRLTISEHRGHLLPDTEDISLPRGALTVGLHSGTRQRICRQPRSLLARRSRQVAARRTRSEARAATSRAA